ncbi:MAG: hypothetical protein C0615_01600 [Desulfuromonas sp.]|nr:MAG: hypothetical protein C0615_01600 [Desulfuromonas sp.]
MNNSNLQKRIAFWLLPCTDDAAKLTRMIGQLADRFDTVRFEPHLTLQVFPEEQVENPRRFLRESVATLPPVTLETTGYARWSEQFNQALTLPIQMSPQLHQMVTALHPERFLPVDYHPHISLLYGHLSEEPGQNLCTEIKPQPTYHFDRCAAVRVGLQTSNDDDVLAWETLATVPLSGPL